MDEINLDSFEKSILSDIKGLKPKSRQRGYAKELIKKLYSGIEQALTNGCSYEEIAGTISNKNIKISPTTLKRYHAANKAGNPEAEMSKNLDTEEEKAKRKQTNFSKEDNSNKLEMTPTSQKKESAIKEEDKPGKIPPILTGASLTDEDYLDDFNDY